MHELVELPAGAGATILFVEEDNDVRAIAKRTLRALGYRVLVAADMEDAREWVSDTYIPADLVLVNLVGRSDEEALRVARELRDYARYDGQTPLVVRPESVAEEMEGKDDNVSGNDWICYYEDSRQLHRLIAHLTTRGPVRGQ